jgi:hypothetical protein
MLPQLTDKRNVFLHSSQIALMQSRKMPEDDPYSNTARIDMAEEDALR